MVSPLTRLHLSAMVIYSSLGMGRVVSVCILYDSCTKVIDTCKSKLQSNRPQDVQGIISGGKTRLARLARLRCDGWGSNRLGRI